MSMKHAGTRPPKESTDPRNSGAACRETLLAGTSFTLGKNAVEASSATRPGWFEERWENVQHAVPGL